MNFDVDDDVNLDLDIDSLTQNLIIACAYFYFRTRIAQISRMFEVFDLLRGAGGLLRGTCGSL